MPRFHALLPVRDEADILGQCLDHLLTWADAVYVFDTGSVDDTWEIVQEAACADKRIVPVQSKPVYYSEMRLRGYLFDVARRSMEDGDWFLRVDADEFHHVLPPVFVRERMRPHETIAYHQYYDFRLTASEAAAWERGEESVADRARPIEKRRRHFTVAPYSEPRLCRYRSTMQWPETVAFPFNAGFIARERLPIRHYPHRDPNQLRRRCQLRAVMMKHVGGSLEKNSFTHWRESDWREFVVADDAPGLNTWHLGEPLPDPGFTTHIQRPHVRLAQRLAHGLLLPVLDRRRPSFDAEPDPLPPEVVAELEDVLTEVGE